MKFPNVNPQNRSIEDILEDMELRRHPIDRAIERNDFQFIKDNLDLNDDMSLYYVIKDDKETSKEIFEYIFPLFPLEAQRKALRTIASNNRFDYLDFALQYITVDVNDSRPHELACRSGHLDMVKKLESLGIQKSEYSFSYAFDSKDLATIEYFYNGEDFNQYFRHQTEIIPLDVLKFMMSKTELSETFKERILLGAAYAGYIDVIDYLLKLPTPTNSEGALFETVYFGDHLETMKYLLTKAPVLSDISENDYMALDWAYKHNYLDFVDYIINEHHITPETSSEVYDIFKSDNFEIYHRLKK